MEWIYLFLAIAFEICATTAMKLSEGLTKLTYAGVMIVFYVVSFTLLSLSLKKIELGTAYAIWSGFGTAVIATIGIVFFKEIFTAEKFIFISLIIIGVIGLNLSGISH